MREPLATRARASWTATEPEAVRDCARTASASVACAAAWGGVRVTGTAIDEEARAEREGLGAPAAVLKVHDVHAARLLDAHDGAHPARLDLLDDDVALRREVDRASPLRGAPVAGEHVVAIAVMGHTVRQRMPSGGRRRGATPRPGPVADSIGGRDGARHPRHRDESFGASRADRVDLALDNRECQTGDEREEDG